MAKIQQNISDDSKPSTKRGNRARRATSLRHSGILIVGDFLNFSCGIAATEEDFIVLRLLQNLWICAKPPGSGRSVSWQNFAILTSSFAWAGEVANIKLIVLGERKSFTNKDHLHQMTNEQRRTCRSCAICSIPAEACPTGQSSDDFRRSHQTSRVFLPGKRLADFATSTEHPDIAWVFVEERLKAEANHRRLQKEATTKSRRHIRKSSSIVTM